MCRSCAQGGRRCPRSDSTRAQERAASSRYYQRGLARKKIALLADHGIPAITDRDMPVTYHQSENPLDLTGERDPITNSVMALPDKPAGALWTAPGRTDSNGETKTSWTDWKARNDYGTNSGPLTEITPTAGAVIVYLDHPNDAEHLMSSYGTTDATGQRAFDWEAMHRDGIDGVYVSDEMANPGSLRGTSAATNLYGWDNASVAWLSTDRLEVGETRASGTYEYEDPGEGPGEYPEVKFEAGEGQYETPIRPDAANAWSRVPARFRPTDDLSPSPAMGEDAGEATQRSGYRFTSNPGSAPKEMDAYDYAATALKVAKAVKTARGRR